jgi:hypothetical protein
MYIALRKGFFSIVRYDPNMEDLPGEPGAHFLVRARMRGDIERVFGWDYPIQETPKNDYAYRAIIPNDVVARTIVRELASVNYSNFKSSIPVDDELRLSFYATIWGAGMDAQEREQRRIKLKRGRHG